MRRLVWLWILLVPASVSAQLTPGRHHVVPQAGVILPTAEFLRAIAPYPSRTSSMMTENPVITDISLDPGLFTGLRYTYTLTRRLAIEAELDLGVAVLGIRQLEIRPDADPDDEPQFETSTTDARILQYSVQLGYYLLQDASLHPYLVAGVGERILDLRQRGDVNFDPIRDRVAIAGVGLAIDAAKRLTIRAELRNVMYNFLFDNQFAHPERSRPILFAREELFRTTSIADSKFQNDIVFTLNFMVHPF